MGKEMTAARNLMVAFNLYSNDNDEDNNTSIIESLEDMTKKTIDLDVTVLLKNKLIKV